MRPARTPGEADRRSAIAATTLFVVALAVCVSIVAVVDGWTWVGQ